ncbi:MAG: hypothetical protein OEZ02_13840, partial [Anaerolineae bacterium]|nr:hypothetical protein [Anaerolineae bacterium]
MQKRLGLLLLLLVVVNAACGQLTPDPTPLPPTNTPVPSSTSTPLPTPTNTATPTPDLPATAAAQETEAAQAILNKINPVLKDYGFSTNQGSLGEFLDQPVEIKLDTWMEEVYEPFAGEKEFYNYVMHTDITWDSTSGLAICGIYFHSGPNLDKSAQYKFSTLRLSGLPIWEVDYYK